MKLIQSCSLLKNYFTKILVALFSIIVFILPANADGDDNTAVEASRDWLGGIPEAPTEFWKVSFGGRLYDSWALATDADEPEETHPSYPKEGKQSGYATWRCKECHGWDYRGVNGVYSSGSHFTGIKGIRAMSGRNPEMVKAIIRDDTHRYTKDMISDEHLEFIALFVTRGQHRIERFIDMETLLADGDAAVGEVAFQNVCAACHGFDGRAIDFKAGEPVPEFIGTVSAKAPWEVMHKVRNGQPGSPMPALRFLSHEILIGILAYAQNLPKE